jgi:hypothetical protein
MCGTALTKSHSSAHQAEYQADQEDNNKDGKEHFSDCGCTCGYTAEAEDGGHYSYDKENQSPPQHFISLLFSKFPVGFLLNIV